jgi:RNA polymerase sigma-70 factor (ECF subfamily)
MDEPQERDIAHGLRKGRDDAWRALYDAYAERVWRAVARLMGPDAADVPDVVQETFLAAARSAAGYDPDRGPLWPWLWGIARRHVALHYRKQERHTRLQHAGDWLAASNGHVLRCLEGREETPAAVLEAAELATLVRATLIELPEDYETLLTAKYLDGVPVEHLARQARCTSTAVRSKLARARTAFRQAFAKYAALVSDPTAREHHEPT